MKRNDIRLVNVSDKLFRFIRREAKKNKRTIQAQVQYILESFVGIKK